jgi:hypothetical protein
MISFKATKAAGFLLASAGVLLHANSVLAADYVADAQTQASNLLAGVNGRDNTAEVAPAISVDHEKSVDPQDQARQLILGETNADRDANRVIGGDSSVASARAMRAAANPQDSARRMIMTVAD